MTSVPAVTMEVWDRVRRSSADRHPWLDRVPWFTEAADRLTAALPAGDAVGIGMAVERDREPTAGVKVDTRLPADELDDLPGLRRIERRAPELARAMPAKPPFGVHVHLDADNVIAHVRWHHPGSAVLLAHRRADGWHSADMLVVPQRHLMIPDALLLAREATIIEHIDRLLGGGRIHLDAQIHSAMRRNEEIRVILGAGAIRDVPAW